MVDMIETVPDLGAKADLPLTEEKIAELESSLD